MKIVSGETMRQIDIETIGNNHANGLELMERAGRMATVEIIDFLGGCHADHVQRIVVVCGKGNNGGDGFVIARLLARQTRYEVKVLCTHRVDAMREDARLMARELLGRVPMERVSFIEPHLRPGDVIVDCLFGTGVTEPLRQPYLGMVEAINASRLPVIAIDISSGLHATTGAVMGAAVRADLTITVGLPKSGFFRGEGRDYCGQLRCVEIGFPSRYLAEAPSEGEAIFKDDVLEFFNRRSPRLHKYQCGSVLIVGGSSTYDGAPLLAAEAALRAGAGMVTLARPLAPWAAMGTNLHSLIHLPLHSEEKVFEARHLAAIRAAIDKADVIVAGPGMCGEKGERAVMELVLSSGKGLVLDAGAINHIAELASDFPLHADSVITPHSGELSRLCTALGLEGADPQEKASALAARLGIHVVLKGQHSRVITPAGEVYVNTSGTAGLATAGSGDVLAGLCGAYMSVGKNFLTALQAAVFIHGLAGELSPAGIRGLIADDLPGLIPQAMRKVSPFA